MDRKDALRARAEAEAAAEANGHNGAGPESTPAAKSAGRRPRPPRRTRANGRGKDAPAHKELPDRPPEAETTPHASRPRSKAEQSNGHPAPQGNGQPGQRTEANGCNGKRRDAGGPERHR